MKAAGRDALRAIAAEAGAALPAPPPTRKEELVMLLKRLRQVSEPTSPQGENK